MSRAKAEGDKNVSCKLQKTVFMSHCRVAGDGTAGGAAGGQAVIQAFSRLRVKWCKILDKGGWSSLEDEDANIAQAKQQWVALVAALKCRSHCVARSLCSIYRVRFPRLFQ